MTANLLLLTGVEFQPQNGQYVVYTYMCKYLALCFHMHSSGLTDSNSQTLLGFRVEAGGTGVSGLTRGLATLPPRWIQELSVVRDRDGRPQEDHVAVHCFCV